MPITFFARQQEIPRPKLIEYAETIATSGSTDSQIDACKERNMHKLSSLKYTSRENVESSPQTCDVSFQQPSSRSPSSSSSSTALSNPFRKTSPVSPAGSWRAKDISARSPIFREERAAVSDELESMWMIQRCDAFCYDDSESEVGCSYNYVSDDDEEFAIVFAET